MEERNKNRDKRERGGAITETGNRRMLAGRDLYKDRVENGANPGRGLEDIYIQVDANIIIASLIFILLLLF